MSYNCFSACVGSSQSKDASIKSMENWKIEQRKKFPLNSIHIDFGYLLT